MNRRNFIRRALYLAGASTGGGIAGYFGSKVAQKKIQETKPDNEEELDESIKTVLDQYPDADVEALKALFDKMQSEYQKDERVKNTLVGALGAPAVAMLLRRNGEETVHKMLNVNRLN